MLLRMALVSTLLIACGNKDKADGGGGGAAAAGGPSCSEAAAFYLDKHVKGGGNKISPGIKPPPTPDEIKTLTAAFEADCNKRPWSAKEKTCILAIKSLLTDDNCFKGLDVAQMVHDAAGAIIAAREAAGGAAGSGSAAGSAADGSAAGSGSAAAGSAAGSAAP